MAEKYNILEEYRLKYYQLPKVLFTNDNYKSLSNDAKVAWSILHDRFNLSKKNNWIDDQGNIYFVYNNKDLMDILNIKSEATVIKIKKELVKAKLLEQKRQGLNKCNLLYLLKPRITRNDIYAIDKLENSTPLDGGQNQESQGTTKNEVQEVQNLESINTDLNNSLNIDTNDTYEDTNISNFSKNSPLRFTEEEQDQLFKQAFLANNTIGIDKRIPELIVKFAENIDQVESWYGILKRAKSSAEKEYRDQYYRLAEETGDTALLKKIESTTFLVTLENGEVANQIINSLIYCVRKIKKDELIEKADSYLFISLKKTFFEILKESNSFSEYVCEHLKSKHIPGLSLDEYINSESGVDE
ncbi:replication initiator protein A [Pseudobacillus sp. 179-B 2D1 NHS]|uniref:replication initiator protein A n=1 Tax=Pseudobacillus sp. 179-B 2D1 NHS TaxID=3374292 RepID=UPI0038796BB4